SLLPYRASLSGDGLTTLSRPSVSASAFSLTALGRHGFNIPPVGNWTMDARYGPSNITTVLAFSCTAWLVLARICGMAVDSNWPVIYFIGLVGYTLLFPGHLDARYIYLGSVAALFLRFEFMGGAFLKFVRLVDFLVSLYFLYAFATGFIL